MISSFNPPAAIGLIPPVLYISCFVHEIGHALIGRAVGFTVTSLGMGIARFWCVFKWRGVVTYFGVIRPFQGLAFVVMPQFFPSRWQMAGFSAGGILANATLALLALALSSLLPRGNTVWLTVAAVNGVLVASNLIPFQFKAGKAPMRSDGMLILQALRSNTLHASAPIIIQSVRSLRPLWESIGDDVYLRLSLLSAAMAWAEFEDFERAEQLLAEVESRPNGVIPIVQFYEETLRLAIAFGTGRLDQGRKMLNAAEDHCRSVGNEAGLFLLAITRASEKALSGDATGSAADFDALTSHHLAKHHPTLTVSLLGSRIQTYAAVGDAKVTEELLAEYETIRRTRTSEIRDLRVYRAVARLYARQDDWVRAERSYRQVVMALRELANAWTDVADKTRFLQIHSPVLEEARHCFETLGIGADLEALIEPLTNPAAGARRTVEARREIDRKLKLAGLRILLVNVACLAFTTWFDSLAPSGASPPFRMLRIDLILCTVVSLPLLVVYLLISRLILDLRVSVGAVMLVVACLPWIAAVLFLLPL